MPDDEKTTETLEEQTDETESVAVEEFERDSDGNIIIPEVQFEDEEDNGDHDKRVDSDKEDVSTDEEKPDDKKEGEKEPKTEKVEEESEAEKENKELKAKIAALEKQSKATLEALGVASDDILGGMEQLAAEANGKNLEEYRKEKTEAAQQAEARRTSFDTLMANDLAELHRCYPETQNISSLTQMENFVEFGKLRDKGLSVKQAYAAANPDGVRKSVEAAVKQSSLNGTKDHLRSVAPQSAKDASIQMSQKDLASWREIFPDKTDAEIKDLYQRAVKK